MLRLLELRTEKKLSQREMAKKLNISQGTYNNWEHAKTQPSIEQLIEISRFFNVSVDYLIGNADDYGLINVKDNLSPEQRKMLQLFNRLDHDTKTALITLLNSISQKQYTIF